MIMGPWELPDEELLEMAQRVSRAEDISLSDIDSLDADAKTAVISGSSGSAYSVSLDGCDCADFERRGLPCKHMVRLALEFGHTFDVPQFDPLAAADYDVEEDIDRLVSRWRSGQLTLDALSKCISALKSSAAKAKKRRGRPKKSAEDSAACEKIQILDQYNNLLPEFQAALDKQAKILFDLQTDIVKEIIRAK